MTAGRSDGTGDVDPVSGPPGSGGSDPDSELPAVAPENPNPIVVAARPPLALLRDPVLGPFLAGSLTSNVGTWMQNVAAAIVVFDLTGSAFFVGLLVAAQFGPALLLSPWAGALADRVDRRLLLIASQTLAGMAALVLALWTAISGPEGLPGPWPLFGAAVLIGIGYAFSIPSLQALVGALVDRPDLEGALALNSVSFNLARAVGPATGALVMVTWGPAAAFGLNAATYAVFILVLALMPRRKVELRDASRGTGSDGSVREGFRFVLADRPLLLLIVGVGALGFASDPVNTLAPAVADALGGGDALVGMLVSAFGVGSVLAATVVTWVRRRVSQGMVALVGLGMLSAGMAALAVAPQPVTAVTSLAVAGFGFLLAITSLTAQIYARVPDDYRGRVLALWGVAFLGSRPLAGLVDGALADEFSAHIAVAFAAGVGFAATTVFWIAWRAKWL
ncbi:MAG: MFS transporter [Dehalococcoidia bacterium]